MVHFLKVYFFSPFPKCTVHCTLDTREYMVHCKVDMVMKEDNFYANINDDERKYNTTISTNQGFILDITDISESAQQFFF